MRRMGKSVIDRRRRELARIHILAAELGLDRDQYEAVLWVHGRVESAAKLDEHGRQAVIRQLESRLPPTARSVRARVGDDRAPLLRKALAMLGDRGERYGLGVLRQMYGRAAPERLEFASAEQLRKLVAALNYNKRRQDART